jgi:hypothetical protein
MPHRYGVLTERLLDILIASLNSHRIPLKMGWELLELYQYGRLDSPKGRLILKRACTISEPEKTKMVLRRDVR